MRDVLSERVLYKAPNQAEIVLMSELSEILAIQEGPMRNIRFHNLLKEAYTYDKMEKTNLLNKIIIYGFKLKIKEILQKINITI